MKMRLFGGSVLAALGAAGLAGAPAWAQSAGDAPKGDDLSEVVVTATRDLAGVVQKAQSSTLFGIDKPLVDTPRSITDISDELLSRYNIKTVYDFTAVAAGTYTGSFFGVPGSIAIRGSIADNYFNGFQGIQNFANFPTPVDSASDIEIVRGPPSPIYGSGQVGGFMNFRPKSAAGEKSRYVDHLTGYATLTGGSYSQREGTANIALPVKLGANAGGLNLYGKLEDSDSFYRGMSPKSQIGQATFTSDLGAKASVELSYQFIHSDGYLKNIGWNRVTQDLIDNGNYVSGRPASQIVAAGADSITRSQFYAVTGGKTIQLYAPAIGSRVTSNSYMALDPATVHTVKLSPRTTFLDPGYDVNEARSHTGYGALSYAFDEDSVLKFESFLNTLNARNYQSYGFATVFDATVTEQRLSYKLNKTFGALRVQAVAGGTWRHSKSHDLGSLNDFVISEDRRDLSVGPTPDDRFNDPFHGANFVWATDIRSTIDEKAAFGVLDLTLGRFSVTGGGRYDNYDVKAVNSGREVNGVITPRSDTSSPFTYNGSVNYKFDWATFYGTYAKARSLQLSQGGAVNPTLIPTGAYLGPSELREIGVKSSQFGGRLFIALDAYRQERSYLATPPTGAPTVSAIRTKGVEAELRWLVTSRFGLTGTATYQKTRQLPTAGSGTFVSLPSCLSNVGCTGGYGGYVYTLTNFFGLTNGYTLQSSPRYSGSLFATYDGGRWGLTGGATYASHTGGFLPGAIKLPSYVLAKAGAYGVIGPVRVDFNIDNLFDKRYFIVNSDADANANVLPGVGRTWHLKATYSF